MGVDQALDQMLLEDYRLKDAPSHEYEASLALHDYDPNLYQLEEIHQNRSV